MNTQVLEDWSPRALSILRIVAAVLFFEHGTQKLFGFPPRAEGASGPEIVSLLGAAGIMEIIGGGLLILGLFTRPVALLVAGEMAIAYWMAHAPKSFFPALNGGDAAILYCFIFLYIFCAGPGPWSLDAKRSTL